MTDYRTVASKMPATLADEVKAAAEAAGVSASRWLADAARARLGHQDAPEGPGAGRRARSGPSGDASGECPHPRAKLQVKGWGTLCGECGLRLR